MRERKEEIYRNFELWKYKTKQDNIDEEKVFKCFLKKYQEFKKMWLQKQIIDWYLRDMMQKWNIPISFFYLFIEKIKKHERGKAVIAQMIESW